MPEIYTRYGNIYYLPQAKLLIYIDTQTLYITAGSMNCKLPVSYRILVLDFIRVSLWLAGLIICLGLLPCETPQLRLINKNKYIA